jgi:hypothetical protein
MSDTQAPSKERDLSEYLGKDREELRAIIGERDAEIERLTRNCGEVAAAYVLRQQGAPSRPFTPEEARAYRSFIEEYFGPAPEPEEGCAKCSNVAPIAKVTVWAHLPPSVELYAPGLPPGEHDLYPAASSPPPASEPPVAWRRLLCGPECKKDWRYTDKQPTVSPERWEPLYSRPAPQPESEPSEGFTVVSVCQACGGAALSKPSAQPPSVVQVEGECPNCSQWVVLRSDTDEVTEIANVPLVRCACGAHEWPDDAVQIEDSRNRLHTLRGCQPSLTKCEGQS